jgi:hypothetical protein
MESKWRSFPNDLGNAVSNAKTTAQEDWGKKTGGVWNELGNFKADFSKFCDDWKQQMRNDCEQRYKEIQQFLASKHVVTIPFTPEIMCQGKRLMISGLMRNSRDSDQDAYIVQSLIGFFEKHKEQDAILYFCSENKRDFAVDLENDKGIALKDGIRHLLPPSSFFEALQPSVKAAREHKQPIELNPEELQKAEAREKEAREHSSSILLRPLGQWPRFEIPTSIIPANMLESLGQWSHFEMPVNMLWVFRKPVEISPSLREALLQSQPYVGVPAGIPEKPPTGPPEQKADSGSQ